MNQALKRLFLVLFSISCLFIIQPKGLWIFVGVLIIAHLLQTNHARLLLKYSGLITPFLFLEMLPVYQKSLIIFPWYLQIPVVVLATIVFSLALTPAYQALQKKSWLLLIFPFFAIFVMSFLFSFNNWILQIFGFLLATQLWYLSMKTQFIPLPKKFCGLLQFGLVPVFSAAIPMFVPNELNRESWSKERQQNLKKGAQILARTAGLYAVLSLICFLVQKNPAIRVFNWELIGLKPLGWNVDFGVNPYLLIQEADGVLDLYLKMTTASVLYLLHFILIPLELFVGFAFVCGVSAPLNLNAPFRATSFADFFSRLFGYYSQLIVSVFYLPMLRLLHHTRLSRSNRRAAGIFLALSWGGCVFHLFTSFFLRRPGNLTWALERLGNVWPYYILLAGLIAFSQALKPSINKPKWPVFRSLCYAALFSLLYNLHWLLEHRLH